MSWDALKPIVLKELHDARRNRWLIGYTVLLAVLGVIIASVGSSSTAGLSLQMFGRTTATLINMCLFVAPLVAVTLGAGSIAGERDMGTLEHLLAQPIERSELLIGKYIGLWSALTFATLAGFAPAGVLIGSLAGISNATHFLLFPLLAILVISAMLAVGMFVSVRSRGRAEAQTTAILLWFAFVIAYDLLFIGGLSIVRLPANALAVLLFLNPIDAGRVIVTLALDPELYVLGPAGAYLLDTLGNLGTSALLTASLFIWSGLPLYLANKRFSKLEGLARKTANHPPVHLNQNTASMTSTRKTLARSAAALFFALGLSALSSASLTSCGGGEQKLNPDAQNGQNTTTTTATTAGPDIEIAMTPANIELGKATYQTTCAPCHGPGGKGDGPAAAALNPKPRDHTNGAYMDKLTNQHLYDVIKKGGAAFGFPTMPAQPQLADDSVKNVIAFVRSLSATYKK
jgi:Cu-processing system permease protein